MNMMTMFIWSFLLTIMVVLTKKNHFLMVLLSLESITLTLMMMTSLIASHNNMLNMLLSIIVLTLGACEASMGLCLLVMMTRKTGSDMLKNLSMSSC